MTPTDKRAAELSAAFEGLQQRVGPVVAQTVDALQVAAMLEADGVTDAIAQDVYGFSDVFTLAAELRRRTVPGPAAVGTPGPLPPELGSGLSALIGRAHRWARVAARAGSPLDERPARTIVWHGLLYLLPVAVFPAAISFMSGSTVVRGMALGAALAWIWAGTSCWAGYQLLGAGRGDEAGRLLRRAMFLGVAVAPATAVVIALVRDTDWWTVPLAAGQMAYQMGAATLMFLRREGRIAVAMSPAVFVGLVYIVEPTRLAAVLTVATAAVCMVAVLVLAAVASRRMPEVPSPAAGELRLVRGAVPVTVSTAFTAAYLLTMQAGLLGGPLAAVLSLVPLILAMGVVELRALRFRGRARALLQAVQYPNEFRSGVRSLVAVDLALCAVAVLVPGAVLTAVFLELGIWAPNSAVVILAAAFLACAYYGSFLLSGLARWLPQIVVTATALGGYVLLTGSPWARATTALWDASAFAGTALILLVLSLVALLPTVTTPRTHA